MSYGFELLNRFGRQVIDQEFDNLIFFEKKSGTMTWSNNNGFPDYTGVVYFSTPIPANSYYALLYRCPPANQGTYCVLPIINNGLLIGARAISFVDFSTFEIALCVGSSTVRSLAGSFGMQVFNSSGKIVFDSNNRYIHIGGAVTLSATGQSGVPGWTGGASEFRSFNIYDYPAWGNKNWWFLGLINDSVGVYFLPGFSLAIRTWCFDFREAINADYSIKPNPRMRLVHKGTSYANHTNNGVPIGTEYGENTIYLASFAE